jgi:hypothetical protein
MIGKYPRRAQGLHVSEPSGLAHARCLQENPDGSVSAEPLVFAGYELQSYGSREMD